MKELSPLQIERLKYQPKLPLQLRNGVNSLSLKLGNATQSVRDQEQIKALFPNTYGKPVVSYETTTPTAAEKKNVGVILSGGQAPGGHNVIAGLFDALKQSNPENKLYGFLGGPSGIIDGKYIELTSTIARSGSGRTARHSRRWTG